MVKRDEGKPAKPTLIEADVKVNVRLPFAQYSNARKLAADRGQTFNAWLCGVISEAVTKSG